MFKKIIKSNLSFHSFPVTSGFKGRFEDATEIRKAVLLTRQLNLRWLRNLAAAQAELLWLREKRKSGQEIEIWMG